MRFISDFSEFSKAENGVMLDIYRDNVFDIKNNSVFIDYGILQHFFENETFSKKPFIRHLAGQSNDSRLAYSLNYYNKHVLN